MNDNGASMNDIIHTGSKIQGDLVGVLLRFRRFIVALVCDVGQMYLCLGVSAKDQPYHWFFWGDLNQ